MTENKVLITAALFIVLAGISGGCKKAEVQTPMQQEKELSLASEDMEQDTRAFSKPDKYGVMCYRHVWGEGFACVKVTEPTEVSSSSNSTEN